MGEWPSLEEDLRDPVAKALREDGYSVRHEVWINGRIADLYAFDDDGTTLAVELKLTDWQKASVQAMAYQLGALYTYVALPMAVIPRVVRNADMLKRHNIGLIGVEPPETEAPGFETADRAPTEAPPPEPVEGPHVRVIFEALESDRYLPFLAEKIVRDAKRPKRRPTVLPMD